jgi:hypothetical protein
MSYVDVLLISNALHTQYIPENCWTQHPSVPCNTSLLLGNKVDRFCLVGTVKAIVYHICWYCSKWQPWLSQSHLPSCVFDLYCVICFQGIFPSILNSYALVQPDWWSLGSSFSTTLLDNKIHSKTHYLCLYEKVNSKMQQKYKKQLKTYICFIKYIQHGND